MAIENQAQVERPWGFALTASRRGASNRTRIAFLPLRAVGQRAEIPEVPAPSRPPLPWLHAKDDRLELTGSPEANQRARAA